MTHTIRIENDSAAGAHGRVFMDGQEVKGCKRVVLNMGVKNRTLVTLTMLATVDCEVMVDCDCLSTVSLVRDAKSEGTPLPCEDP